MTYKKKSLLYFLCFIASATGYYLLEQHQNFNAQLESSQMVENQFEDDYELEETLDETLKKPQE